MLAGGFAGALPLAAAMLAAHAVHAVAAAMLVLLLLLLRLRLLIEVKKLRPMLRLRRVDSTARAECADLLLPVVSAT